MPHPTFNLQAEEGPLDTVSEFFAQAWWSETDNAQGPVLSLTAQKLHTQTGYPIPPALTASLTPFMLLLS